MDTAQHPPMNGDDDLAKTLGAGLQFEETPVTGKPGQDQAMAPTLGPVPDPAALGLTDNSSADDLTVPDMPDLTDTPKQEDKKESDMPTIHRGHKPDTADVKTDGTLPDLNASMPAMPKMSSDLEKIKTSALEELRPLVSKLNLPPEEKFDTLLLIIRTTDDQGLLEEAHTAAKTIEDDTRRAQALLDIIKEIDYFSTKR